MKHIIALLTVYFVTAFTTVQAAPADAWQPSVSTRPLETIDEARQRHSAERYETYRRHGHEAPLGGYSERFGDPAPRGTELPGYNPIYRPLSDINRR